MVLAARVAKPLRRAIERGNRSPHQPVSSPSAREAEEHPDRQPQGKSALRPLPRLPPLPPSLTLPGAMP